MFKTGQHDQHQIIVFQQGITNVVIKKPNYLKSEHDIDRLSVKCSIQERHVYLHCSDNSSNKGNGIMRLSGNYGWK